MKESQENKKNDRVGLIVSVSLHVLILIIFFFLIAWREPDPPRGIPGVELPFGMSNVGEGDKMDNSPVAEQVQEVPIDEVAPEPEPQPEVAEEAVEEVSSISNVESPDVVEKKKEVQYPAPKKTETKTETKKEQLKEEVKKTETPKETVTKTSGSEGKGDDAQTGKKGDPKGDIDSRATYTGNPGNNGAGGKGTDLQLAGWELGFNLDEKDQSSESGFIIYKIMVDEDGELLSITPLEKSVSTPVEKFYTQQIRSKWMIYRLRGFKSAPASVGKLKVIVESN